MTETTLACPACGLAMAKVEEIRKDQAGNELDLTLYKCPTNECSRKAVVMFEPKAGYSAETQTFIEREIARRGAFFPTDYTGGHRRL